MTIRTKTGKTKNTSPSAIETAAIIPGEEEIRNLAELIYHQRLIYGESGSALGDWLLAENFLRSTNN